MENQELLVHSGDETEATKRMVQILLDQKNFDFRVYVKGLVDESTGGIGVAICDSSDNMVFEVSKGLTENEHEHNGEFVEVKALIEGLDVAAKLGIRKIIVAFDNPLIYKFITGKTNSTHANIAALSEHMNFHQKKFTNIHTSIVLRTTGKMSFAYELAKKAAFCQATCLSTKTSYKESTAIYITCTICLEDTDLDQMFLINDCLHTYCISCMSKHVRFKLLEGILPKCPFENCKSELKPAACKKILTPELFQIMSQRIEEASIPDGEKIYCPISRCSALLVKSDSRVNGCGASKCKRCETVFCANCQVPWHSGMTCSKYKRLNPPQDVDELMSLAANYMWRQCPRCNHMVSRADGRGCNHVRCRCGHDFCYICGAKMIFNRRTCVCPISDLRYSMLDSNKCKN